MWSVTHCFPCGREALACLILRAVLVMSRGNMMDGMGLLVDMLHGVGQPLLRRCGLQLFLAGHDHLPEQ
eukprot:6177179-Prorocentrum_lima.AAC.1